jgi:hypothetical protein
VFGILAISTHHTATGLCPSSPCKNLTGVNDENQAEADAIVSDVTLAIGLAAIGGGAYLVTRKAPAKLEVSLVPTVERNGGGAAVVAVF